MTGVSVSGIPIRIGWFGVFSVVVGVGAGMVSGVGVFVGLGSLHKLGISYSLGGHLIKCYKFHTLVCLYISWYIVA